MAFAIERPTQKTYGIQMLIVIEENNKCSCEITLSMSQFFSLY